jgi:GT2 family glycosyltransferase
MKTMVVVPCMDMVQTEFCQSLVRMKTIGETRFDFISCSLIYKARTDLGLIALKEKADFVLWLDSDMVFPSDLLVDLMKDIEGRDIVKGIYHMRRAPFRPVIYKTLKQGLVPAENVSEHYDDYPKDGLFKVDGCGFGCVLMRAGVLQSVVDKYHELFAPLPGYGEDLSFCVRARGCGYEIWADPKIQLGHKAATIVTNETFDAYRGSAGAIDD